MSAPLAEIVDWATIGKVVAYSLLAGVGLSLVFSLTIHGAMSRSRAVRHHGTQLTFAVPNRLNRFRIDTFSTKEPETLDWIDAIQEGSVLWDIGANVGLYSCYAAKARRCRVVAFEPSRVSPAE